MGEGGVQTGPDVVGLWAAEAAGLGEGVLSRRERRRGVDVGAYFIEARSSDLPKVYKPFKPLGPADSHEEPRITNLSPGCSHTWTRETRLLWTPLLKLAMPQEKAPEHHSVLNPVGRLTTVVRSVDCHRMAESLLPREGTLSFPKWAFKPPHPLPSVVVHLSHTGRQAAGTPSIDKNHSSC